MKLLSGMLAEAGLGHFSAIRVVLLSTAVLTLVALAITKLSGLIGVGLAAFFLGAALAIELVKSVASARYNTLIASLPEVCESLASAVASGQELVSAMADLAVNGPKNTRKSFEEWVRMDEKGIALEQTLDWLAVELSNVYADQLIELLRVSHRSGGFGLVANLGRLSTNLRQQVALHGELQAKQGWVTGTAKLALAAPWAIVYLLGLRGQNAAFYNSTAGLTLLLVGLGVCLFAYLLIVVMGRMPTPKRVFAQ